VDSPHDLLESKYGVQVLTLLRRQVNPLSTGDILDALQVRNWTAVSKTLYRLEAAGLVTVQRGVLGPNRKRANLWRIEPNHGVKVAEALEEAQRRMTEAKPNGRTGIATIEPERKLVAMIENVVKNAIGS
jgi:DNA-binding transcriptional ArsR family regulator